MEGGVVRAERMAEGHCHLKKLVGEDNRGIEKN